MDEKMNAASATKMQERQENDGVSEAEPVTLGPEIQVNQMSGDAFWTVECMDHAAAVMFHLGNALFSNKKIRVTIERDPETGKCTMKREILS